MAAPNGRERRREGNSAARERIHGGAPTAWGCIYKNRFPCRAAKGREKLAELQGEP